jgi:hypothetical protein
VPEDRQPDRTGPGEVIGRAGDEEAFVGPHADCFQGKPVGTRIRLAELRPLGRDDGLERNVDAGGDE